MKKITAILLLPLVLIHLVSVFTVHGSNEVNVTDALAELDMLFDAKAQLEWKTKLYDPDTGAFYYALSSVKNNGFGPTLEATAVVNFKYNIAPDEIGEKAGKWVQSLQDPETGYFIEPEYNLNSVPLSKKGRDLTWALNILSKCEMKPLYKTPAERVGGTTTVKTRKTEGQTEEFLTSLDNALEWLETNFDWETSRGMWSAGNTLDGYFPMMEQLGYAKPVLEFIASKQNPQTGMWGPELSYEAVSGAAKFSGMFSKDVMSYPNLDKLYESVTELMHTDTPENIVQTYNLVYTMYKAKETYDETDLPEGLPLKLEEILPDVIKEATYQLSLYKKPDGVFGYALNKGQPTSQGVSVSLGVNEGDVNGNSMALTTRNYLYRLAGRYAPALYDDEEWIRRVSEKAPITEPYVKIENMIANLFEPFNDAQIKDGVPYVSDVDDYWAVDSHTKATAVTNYEIVSDPDDYDNKVLKVNKTKDAYDGDTPFLSGLRHVDTIYIAKNPSSFSVFFKFRLEPTLSGNIAITNGQLNEIILSPKAEGFTLGHRKMSSSSTTMANLSYGIWYKYRCDVRVSGDVCYQDFYIDDTKIGSLTLTEADKTINNPTTTYVSKSLADSDGTYWEIYGTIKSRYTIYVDDIGVDFTNAPVSKYNWKTGNNVAKKPVEIIEFSFIQNGNRMEESVSPGDVTAYVNLTNFGKTVNAKLILAQYCDNMLVGVKTEEFEIESASWPYYPQEFSTQLTAVTCDVAGKHKLKAFFWDGCINPFVKYLEICIMPQNVK